MTQPIKVMFIQLNKATTTQCTYQTTVHVAAFIALSEGWFHHDTHIYIYYSRNVYQRFYLISIIMNALAVQTLAISMIGKLYMNNY